jgi:hypothetical protein
LVRGIEDTLEKIFLKRIKIIRCFLGMYREVSSMCRTLILFHVWSIIASDSITLFIEIYVVSDGIAKSGMAAASQV